jgi:hypothetical protein
MNKTLISMAQVKLQQNFKIRRRPQIHSVFAREFSCINDIAIVSQRKPWCPLNKGLKLADTTCPSCRIARVR